MGDDDQIDLCPFCNAPWGTCVHIKILLEWEQEALAREAQEDLEDGSGSGTKGQSLKPGFKH